MIRKKCMESVSDCCPSSLQTHYIWCQSVCCLDVDANQISLIDAPYMSLCFLDTNGVHRHWALIMLVVVSDTLTMCDSCSVQAPWKWMILVYSLQLDRWWFLCTGSLGTDGICICKVPAFDTEDIGCVQGLVWLSLLDTEGGCQWMVSAWCPHIWTQMILVVWAICRGWCVWALWTRMVSVDGVRSDWRGLFATLSPTAFNMQLTMQTPRIFAISHADTHIIIPDKSM